MNIRTLILAILHAQDASGYEIKKLSSQGKFSYFVDVSFGSIYPTLARLEMEGLVACREEKQSGKPDRKIYSLTPQGEAELVHALSQPPARDKFKSEFLLVAMHAELAGRNAIERAVQDRIRWLEEELAMLSEAETKCTHAATSWAIRYGKAVMSHDLAYLREHVNELAEIAVNTNQEAAE